MPTYWIAIREDGEITLRSGYSTLEDAKNYADLYFNNPNINVSEAMIVLEVARKKKEIVKTLGEWEDK